MTYSASTTCTITDMIELLTKQLKTVASDNKLDVHFEIYEPPCNCPDHDLYAKPSILDGASAVSRLDEPHSLRSATGGSDSAIPDNDQHVESDSEEPEHGTLKKLM